MSMLKFPKLSSGISVIDSQWNALTRKIQKYVEHHPVENADVVAFVHGDIVRAIAGVRQAVLAQASSTTNADYIGIMSEPTPVGASGVMATSGVVLVRMENALVPVEGNTIYVSQTTAGAGTNVEPVAGVIHRIGTIVDASMYVTVTNPFVKVLFPRCCTPQEVG